jgi:nucleotide-binding universal stress UspA family protein
MRRVSHDHGPALEVTRMQLGNIVISERVLRWGRFLSERFDAAAIVCYAISLFIPGRIGMVSSTSKTERLERDILRNAEQWLTRRLEELAFAPDRTRKHVVIGDPAFEINAAVQRFDAELVVMGSRGAGAAAGCYSAV